MGVDSLFDIAAEGMDVAADVAIAVGGSLKEAEMKKRRKNKNRFLLSIVVILILSMILIYARWIFFNGGVEGFSLIVDEISYIGLFLITAFALLLMLGAGIAIKMNKENKPLNKIIIFVVISLAAAGVITYAFSSETSSYVELIPIFGLASGLCLMFFLLFNKTGDRLPHGLINFGNAFLIRVCIPMMPILIIFLGAMQGKFGYKSVFLSETKASILTLFGDGMMSVKFYEVIQQMFNIGVQRPDFWIGLTLLIFIVLLYFAIRTAFFGEGFPYERVNPEQHMPAQYFIDKANDKFLSKEDLDAFERNKLRLNKKALDKYEKEESLNKEIQ